jgi:hypothetical protein
MKSSNDMTNDVRINYVKKKIEFFKRPLIYLFPKYPEGIVNSWDVIDFTKDIINIESEFAKFKDKFNLVFNTIIDIAYALEKFEELFYELGYVTLPDESSISGERKQIDFTKLVFYEIEKYKGYSNYWLYHRNWEGDEHIFKGYDEEIKEIALETYQDLINKFKTFKDEKETETLEGSPLPVENESDKNQPSTHIDQKIKERQEELRRSIKADINTLDNQWESAFFYEKDCDHFIEILVSYFTNQKYFLPDDPIPTQKGCKVKLAIVLNAIYKSGRTGKMLKRDEDYLKICKKLFVFSKLNLKLIYRDISRNK